MPFLSDGVSFLPMSYHWPHPDSMHRSAGKPLSLPEGYSRYTGGSRLHVPIEGMAWTWKARVAQSAIFP